MGVQFVKLQDDYSSGRDDVISAADLVESETLSVDYRSVQISLDRDLSTDQNNNHNNNGGDVNRGGRSGADQMLAVEDIIENVSLDQATSKLDLLNILEEFLQGYSIEKFLLIFNQQNKNTVTTNQSLTNWPGSLTSHISLDDIVESFQARVHVNPEANWFEYTNGELLFSDQNRPSGLVECLQQNNLRDGYGAAFDIDVKGNAHIYGLLNGDLPNARDQLLLIEGFFKAVAKRYLSIDTSEGAQFVGLSKREVECIKWTAEGKTSYEIGIILGLSENTINNYIASVTKKLGAVNRSHMISLAFRNGMIE